MTAAAALSGRRGSGGSHRRSDDGGWGGAATARGASAAMQQRASQWAASVLAGGVHIATLRLTLSSAATIDCKCTSVIFESFKGCCRPLCVVHTTWN